MTRADPWSPMAFEPDMDTVIRIGWTVTTIAFVVTVVSILWELRG